MFIGSFVSPIFSRFFRSSLDFKYFMGLIQDDLVYHKIQVPQSITMTIYAISVFGISISLPITLIIYRYSTKLEVKQKLYVIINKIYIFFQAYHPTVTKVRIILTMTLLHLIVDIPSLLCEYFFVDKVSAKPSFLYQA